MDISNILTAEHRAAGIRLDEEEDTATLSLHGKRIAVFGIHAEIAHIHHEADQAINWAKRGISFERCN